MFKALKFPEGLPIRELSLKQREMYIAYKRDVLTRINNNEETTMNSPMSPPPSPPSPTNGATRKKITPVFERHIKDKREGRQLAKEKDKKLQVARKLKYDNS